MRQDSLGIGYTDSDETKIVRPDFIFFAEQDGKVVVDVVDPHGFHLADALPKLQGMARYAQAHPNVYRRIEAVAKLNGKRRVLDLTRTHVRQAVMAAQRRSSVQKCGVRRLRLTIKSPFPCRRLWETSCSCAEGKAARSSLT